MGVMNRLTIMQRLKQETRPYHVALERQVDLTQLCSALDAYQQLLQRFYGFYLPVEQKLDQLPWHTLGFDYPARRKRALLEQDLATLSNAAPSWHHLPCCTALPLLDTLPAALGCLYVLEGATLGGQIITRQVERTLGISPAQGSRFFHSYGDQVGPMWKEFGHFVTSYATTPAIENAMIASAGQTFQALQGWLTQSN